MPYGGKAVTFERLMSQKHYSNTFLLHFCTLQGPYATPSWAPLLPNLGATTRIFWKHWGPFPLFYGSGLSSYSSGEDQYDFIVVLVNIESKHSDFSCTPSPSRPAVASYVSLAFGRYVVEPFFAPCVAPEGLIKLVGILGVSEWSFALGSVCSTHLSPLCEKDKHKS